LEGVGIIIGPIIGGAIASNIGWRWCFWINLPVGAVLSVVILFLLRTPAKSGQGSPKPWTRRVLQADIEGGLTIAGSLTCLLLALQWGGTAYPWSDGRIIALFVVFGVSLICVGFYERRKGEGATFPTRLFKNRTLMMCVLAGFCLAGSQFVVLYYVSVC
jgi:MFS family permease